MKREEREREWGEREVARKSKDIKINGEGRRFCSSLGE